MADFNTTHLHSAPIFKTNKSKMTKFNWSASELIFQKKKTPQVFMPAARILRNIYTSSHTVSPQDDE